MDFLPLIFILWIGFLIFKNFVKSAGQSEFTDKGNNILTAIERADKENAETGDWTFSETKTPFRNGRDSVAFKAPQMPKPKKNKTVYKQPIMKGRRGRNMDQNRHRHDDWGQRGDSSLLSGKTLLILLALFFFALYILSQITPEMIDSIRP